MAEGEHSVPDAVPDCIAAAADDGSDLRPCCVVEARRVVLADAAALALGVEVGMSAASAAARVSGEPSLGGGLQVFARSATREAALVQRMALTLARFTPGTPSTARLICATMFSA